MKRRTSRFKIFSAFLFLLLIIAENKMQAQSTNPYGRKYLEGQMSNPTDPFNLISKRGWDYFASLTPATETEEDEELEEHFNRWEHYWKDHCLYPGAMAGGDVKGATEKLFNIYTNNNVWCNTSPAGIQPWVLEGPDNLPGNDCTMGIITAVAFDPNNANIIYAGSDAGGLFKTTDGGANWVHLADNLNVPGIGILSIEVDPFNSNHIMAGTHSGVFGDTYGFGIIESFTGGTGNWGVTLAPPSPSWGWNVKALKHGTAANVWYAAVGTSIYKSTTNGSSWFTANINTILDYTGPNQIDLSCTGSPQLYDARSQITDIEQSLLNANWIYASTDAKTNYGSCGGAKLLYSTDGGINFNQMTLPFLNSPTPHASKPYDVVMIDVTPADPGALYVFYHDWPSAVPNYCDPTGRKCIIAKTYDNGLNWIVLDNQQNATTFPIDANARAFEMSEVNYHDFFVGTIQIQKGKWDPVTLTYAYSTVTNYYPTPGNNTHADIRSLKARNVGGLGQLLAGCDGGVIQSTPSVNEGNAPTWACINGNGLSVSKFHGIATFQRTNNILASPQDTWTKLRTGNNWVQTYGTSGQGESFWSEVDYAIDNIAYTNQNGPDLFSSSNSGVGFGALTALPGTFSRLTGRRFYIDPTDHAAIWDCSILNTPDNLFKHKNGVWTQYPLGAIGTPAETRVTCMAVAPSNSNIIYAACDEATGTNSKRFYRSPDGGTTFFDFTPAINTPNSVYGFFSAKHITVDPLNANRIFVCFNGFETGSVVQRRVLYSGNGGATWSDMSTGLTNLPVNYMTYQNGSDDVIYAATDAGVYRWNKSSNSWTCFNLQLPKAGVTKVEINYCQNKLYCSVYGRGVYSCVLPSISDFHITTALAPPGSNTVTIPSYYNQTFANKVVVDPGVYLNINGTLNFAPNVCLLVEKNAHVVLSGTLTNNCAALWKGVYVNGDIALDQSYANGLANYQGLMEVIGGRISNASSAITVAGTDIYGSIDYTKTGGIVSTSYANFINNVFDVRIFPYPSNTNKCAFRNTNFYTSNPMLGGAGPAAHVLLYDVQGIAFEGCDFKNNATGYYSPLNGGYGIRSTNARYRVSNGCPVYNYLVFPCASPIQSKFTNLYRGIEAANTNPLRTIEVNDAIFTNNALDAAKFATVNNLKFLNNSITTGTNAAPVSSGLFLDNCQLYRVENNTFNNHPTGTQAVGIYAYNSGAGLHQVYRNTFKRLLLGISPENNNGNMVDGLKMNCNDFTQTPNVYDIAVQSNNGLPPSVHQFQGQPIIYYANETVRNQYAATCGNENKWFTQNILPKNPVTHPSNNNSYPQTQPIPQPGCSDPVVNVIITPFNFNYTTDCPDNVQVDPYTISLEQINIALNYQQVIHHSVTVNYTNTIDGANTAPLLASINSNPATSSLKSQLTGYSPYLSDEVLMAYFSNAAVPYQNIIDIHDLNKPVSPQVWQVIVNRGLPATIMGQLTTHQQAQQYSARSVLDGEYSKANTDLQTAYFNKLDYFTADSLTSGLDSLITLLKANYPKFGNASRLLINAYMDKGDYSKAYTLNDSMQTADPTNAGIYEMQKIIINLVQQPNRFFALNDDAGLLDQVQSIADNTNHAGYLMAQAVLQLINDTQFADVRLVPYESGSGGRMANQNLTNKNNEPNPELNAGFKCYPNPAYTEINYVFESGQGGSADVVLMDGIGRQLYKSKIEFNQLNTISTKNYAPGLYTIQLFQNKKLVACKKIAVAK